MNFRHLLERHKLGEKLFNEINKHLKSQGLIHSTATTSATVHDITQADKLAHGEEEYVWGDASYRGIEKREEHEHRQVDWFIALPPGPSRLLAKNSDAAKAAFKKSQIRVKVKHPFRYIKRVFGYHTVRYRGRSKNMNRLHLLAGFTNLMMARKYLLT